MSSTCVFIVYMLRILKVQGLTPDKVYTSELNDIFDLLENYSPSLIEARSGEARHRYQEVCSNLWFGPSHRVILFSPHIVMIKRLYRIVSVYIYVWLAQIHMGLSLMYHQCIQTHKYWRPKEPHYNRVQQLTMKYSIEIYKIKLWEDERANY